MNFHNPSLSPTISVVIRQPNAGAKTSGAVEVESSATDSSGLEIVKLEFYIDGVKFGQVNAGAGSSSLDTTKFADGRHIISVVATNSEGKTGRNSEFISVDNDGSPDSDGDGIPDDRDDNTGNDDVDQDDDGIPDDEDNDDDNEGNTEHDE